MFARLGVVVYIVRVHFADFQSQSYDIVMHLLCAGAERVVGHLDEIVL